MLGKFYKGVMVYADDTTLVCESIDSLNKCIRNIEKYCDIFDIAINAKKTKCMILGKIKTIVEPEIKVNGQILEIVDTFKFLGVHIDREGNFIKHMCVRKSAFFSGLTEIERLGMNEPDVPISMKCLLYTSLVRSKLLYGMECLNLKSKFVQKEISSLESNTLKRACGLNKLSKTTGLLYAMGITPLELYILKRKLFFILQLLQNKATNELVENGIHRSLDSTLELIGVNREHKQLGPNRYRGIIRSLVVKKLEKIRDTEREIRESKLVQAVNYLLKHRNHENNDTLQYLLDPRRCGLR